MNILFCSVPFRPSIGGIETVSALLAEQLERAGHRVRVVTLTAGPADDPAPFEVVRRPGPSRLFALVRWSDLVFHNNVSLRLAWPLLVLSRPWVVAHHTWIASSGIRAGLKRLALRRARNVAVSKAIANALPVPCTVVPNPYADDTFRPVSTVPRDRELVFVGRLVSDKGASVLMDALGRLTRRGRRVGLTVIGKGPEEAPLRRLAESLDVATQVRFVGSLVGEELVRSLNAHRVLVVPSLWEEPFGMVALEALACGCVPLVARSGGLPEAIGTCGVVVPKGDPEALADAIAHLLDDKPTLEGCRRDAASHLSRHTRDRVARLYLEVIDDACRTHATASAPRAV